MFYDALNALKTLPKMHVYLTPEFVELPFLSSIFLCLYEQLLNTSWQDYEWVLLSPKTPVHVVPNLTDRHILVYMGNEKGHIPRAFRQAAFVFTPYLDFSYAHKNVHVIPLGCNGYTPPLPVLPMSQRDLFFSFTGQVLSERLSFIAQSLEFLGNVKPYDALKAYLTLTPRFQSGLSPETYADILHRSCFAPVPPGISPITFRLFEALRAGCLVVTGPLPPYAYLKDLPALKVSADWKELSPFLQGAFKNPRGMQELQQESLAYYQRVCSPEGVAHQIASAIVRQDVPLDF